MLHYLYDGTFEGLLSCIYAHYYQSKCHGIYRSNQYLGDLVAQNQNIVTDMSHAKKVYDAIPLKISQTSFRTIFHLFLSSCPDKESLILDYLILGFKIGSKIDSLHADPLVLRVQKESKKVSLEVHRFYGLVRFSDMGDFLYSKIEPDNDIIALLGPHFSDRFSPEKIIIHDNRRGIALFAHQGKWFVRDFTQNVNHLKTDAELFFSGLWQDYHKTVAIKERINPKLQKQYMPKRYWDNLTEFNN